MNELLRLSTRTFAGFLSIQLPTLCEDWWEKRVVQSEIETAKSVLEILIAARNNPHNLVNISTDLIQHQPALEYLKKELVIMTDAYTDELFDVVGAHTNIFPVSRLVLDPERFLDDNQEIMAALGMGVIYTRTSSGQRLRYATRLSHICPYL